MTSTLREALAHIGRQVEALGDFTGSVTIDFRHGQPNLRLRLLCIVAPDESLTKVSTVESLTPPA